MAVATFMPSFMMTNITFQIERPVFLREQANKMYGVIPYYFAKLISDIPGFLIVPTAFIAITYFAVGLTKGADLFFMFVLTAIFNTLCAVSLGYMVSCAIKNPTTATMVGPIIALPLMLVGGLFGNQGTMPFYLEIFAYISPL